MTYVLMCIVHLSLYYQVFEIRFSKSFSLISIFFGGHVNLFMGNIESSIGWSCFLHKNIMIFFLQFGLFFLSFPFNVKLIVQGV
jgi:hypothetical protein